MYEHPNNFTPSSSPMEDHFLRFWYRVLKDRAYTSHVLERQCPIGPYYTDFAHVPTQTAIEIDGKQYHYANQEQVRHDLVRQAWLEGKGWTVLRFTGSQVRNHPVQCVQVARNHITARLEESA